MMTHDDFVNQIKRHEGLRLKPYKCSAGKLTIGYGRNLEDVGITEEEAYLLLLNDISDTVVDLQRAKLNVFDSLSKPRQYVLMNMCFNLGINRLLKFKNMWSALADGNYNKAADEMLDSRWSKQVGERSLELADIMRTDVY